MARGSSIIIGKVMDIIMDESHEEYKTYGGPFSIGTISFQALDLPKGKGDKQVRLWTQDETAIPINAEMKRFPLKGEIVLIVKTVSKDHMFNFMSTTSGNDQGFSNSRRPTGKKFQKYYFSAFNIFNDINLNSLHYTLVINRENTKSVSSAEAQRAEDGIPKQAPNASKNTIIPTGDYFIPGQNLFPLHPFEGDTLYESRFGSSIRFGATTPPPSKDLTLKKNNWSENTYGRKSTIDKTISGSVGDPIVIIRNGQRQTGLPDTPGTTILENINNDDASIYMTSNQSINNFEPAGVYIGESIKRDSYFTNLDEEGNAQREEMSIEPDINETLVYQDAVQQSIDETEQLNLDLAATYESEPYKLFNKPNPPIPSFDEENQFLFYEKLKSGLSPKSDQYFHNISITLYNIINNAVNRATNTDEINNDQLLVPEDLSEVQSVDSSGNPVSRIEDAPSYNEPHEAGVDPNEIYEIKMWSVGQDMYKKDNGRTLKKELNFYGDLNKDKNLKPKFFKLKGKAGSSILVPQPSFMPNIKKIMNRGHKGPLGYSVHSRGSEGSRDIKYLMIHCTGSPRGAHPLDIVSGQLYSEAGVDFMGGDKSGYHIIITEKGKISRIHQDYEKAYGAESVIRTGTQGNHVYNWNDHSIHIAWTGGVSWNPQDRPTEFQSKTLIDLCRYFVRRYPNIKILGHNQAFPSTIMNTCPMFYVPSFATAAGIGSKNILKYDEKFQFTHVDENITNTDLKVNSNYYGMDSGQLMKVYMARGKAIGEGKGESQLPR